MRRLTVSLVAWNGSRYLRDCLSSLARQTFQDFELVVTDNGSRDGSAELCKSFAEQFSGRFEFVQNSENTGFAVPHNRVMVRAATPYVFLLNQDVLLDERYLERCLDFLERHSNVGSVSGKILRWVCEFDPQTGALKQSEKSNTIDSLGLQIFKSGRVIERSVGMIDGPDFAENTEVFGVSGTVPIYRKSALDSVAFEGAYFDEDFFAYKEDVDLAFRLRWAGWGSYVVAQALAYHDRTAKSTEGMNLWQKISYRKAKSAITNRNSYRNHLWVLQKNITGGLWRKIGIRVFFEEAKKFLYLLIMEPRTLGQWSTVWRSRKRTAKKRARVAESRKAVDQEMLKWFV